MLKQTPRKTYAFVGDGETEQWYLQMLKKNETILTVTIKPELPQDKSIEDQFAYVQELSVVHDKVFWMVDLDVIIRDTKAFKGPKNKTPAAAKTGSFNPDVLEKGLSEMQKIFEELGI